MQTGLTKSGLQSDKKQAVSLLASGLPAAGRFQPVDIVHDALFILLIGVVSTGDPGSGPGNDNS